MFFLQAVAGFLNVMKYVCGIDNFIVFAGSHWRVLQTHRYSYEQLHQQWHQESVRFNSVQLFLSQWPPLSHV